MTRYKCQKEILQGTYLHNDDKGQFCSQDVPELHGVLVFLLMIWRISIVSVPGEVIDTQRWNVPVSLGHTTGSVTLTSKYSCHLRNLALFEMVCFPWQEKVASQFVSMLVCLTTLTHSSRAEQRMCEVEFGAQVICSSGNDQILQDRVMGSIPG